MDYKLGIIILATVTATFWWMMKVIFNLIPKQEMKLFRILFPSWRFFEGLTPIPKIFYRVSPNNKNYGEWLPLIIQNNPQRSIQNLFHNAQENLQLTYQAQIEQVVNDIAELPSDSELDLTSLTSYKIVYAYIKEQILLRHTGQYFQFKIGALEFHSHQPPVWTETLYSNDCELI